MHTFNINDVVLVSGVPSRIDGRRREGGIITAIVGRQATIRVSDLITVMTDVRDLEPANLRYCAKMKLGHWFCMDGRTGESVLMGSRQAVKAETDRRNGGE